MVILLCCALASSAARVPPYLLPLMCKDESVGNILWTVSGPLQRPDTSKQCNSQAQAAESQRSVWA